jgi:hypothetical protein
VNLLARMDHLSVGRLSEIVPVRRMESVAEYLSSVPGPDGITSVQAELAPSLIGNRGGCGRA